jgi:hypothetical protein
MPPAVFRGKRPGPGRRASAITALVALAAATAAGQAVAATSLRVTVTAKPKAASNVSTATFRWKAQGKVRATLCALDRGRFAKCRSGKRYTKLKDGKHRFRVEVKGSGRTKKIATVSWLVDTTAPSVPVAAGGSLAWQAVPSIAISASGATDLGSGLAGYDYRTSTDGGATWSMPSPGSLDSPSFDGETLVQFAAVDKAGNMSAWAPAPDTAEATARIDNLAPFVPTVSGGDLQWQNAAAVVISASDGADVGGAGFDHYEYRTSTDGVNWSAPAAGSSVPISADNETFVQFRSVDAVGNASSWAPTTPDAGSTVRIDRTIPTNPVVSGGTAGWQNVASALVTAGGSTDAQGAGVAFYQYRSSTDGGQTWSAPALGTSLLVSAEGQTLVEFQSVDNANLDSAWIQTAVEIDRTNPSAPTVSGGSPAWQSVPSIDISASNATDSGGSGVAGYEYRISTDGGATWSPTPIAGWDELVTAPGETLVQFRTVDGAGNTSGWVGATARIDTTAPGDPTASGGSSSWQNAASVDVTGSATGDAGGSGVAGLEYGQRPDLVGPGLRRGGAGVGRGHDAGAVPRVRWRREPLQLGARSRHRHGHREARPHAAHAVRRQRRLARLEEPGLDHHHRRHACRCGRVRLLARRVPHVDRRRTHLVAGGRRDERLGHGRGRDAGAVPCGRQRGEHLRLAAGHADGGEHCAARPH